LPERSIYHCKTGIHSRKTVLITADAFRPARKTTLIPKIKLLLNPPDASFVWLHFRVNKDQVYSRHLLFFVAFSDFDLP